MVRNCAAMATATTELEPNEHDLVWVGSSKNKAEFLTSFGDGASVQVHVLRGTRGWVEHVVTVKAAPTPRLNGRGVLSIDNLEAGHAYLVRRAINTHQSTKRQQWTYSVCATRMTTIWFEGCMQQQNDKDVTNASTSRQQETTLAWDQIDLTNVIEGGFQMAVKYSARVWDSRSSSEADVCHVSGTRYYIHSLLDLNSNSSDMSVVIHFFKVQAVLQLQNITSDMRVPDARVPVTVSDVVEYFTAPAPSCTIRATTSALEMEWGALFAELATRSVTDASQYQVVVEVGIDETVREKMGYKSRPTFPAMYPAEMSQTLALSRVVAAANASNKTVLALMGLEAGGWYWIRTRCVQPRQAGQLWVAPDSVGVPIAIQMPRGRPTPATGLRASYTLYNDDRRYIRHIFIKLQWEPSQDIPAEEYIVQRLDVFKQRNDGEIKNGGDAIEEEEEEWETVCYTSNNVCVLRGLVSMRAFCHRCRFIVRAKNDIGLSDSKTLSVSIKVKASSSLAKKGNKKKSYTVDDFGLRLQQNTHSPQTKKVLQEKKLLGQTRQLVRDYLNCNLVVVTKGQDQVDCVDMGDVDEPALLPHSIAISSGAGRIESVHIENRAALKSFHRKATSPKYKQQKNLLSLSPRKQHLMQSSLAIDVSAIGLSAHFSRVQLASADASADARVRIAAQALEMAAIQDGVGDANQEEREEFFAIPGVPKLGGERTKGSSDEAAVVHSKERFSSNPYRQALYNRRAVKKRISKHVNVSNRLPDLSYVRGMCAELAVQRRLKKDCIVWTNTSKARKAHAAKSDRSKPVNAVPPPGTFDEDDFTSKLRIHRPANTPAHLPSNQGAVLPVCLVQQLGTVSNFGLNGPNKDESTKRSNTKIIVDNASSIRIQDAFIKTDTVHTQGADFSDFGSDDEGSDVIGTSAANLSMVSAHSVEKTPSILENLSSTDEKIVAAIKIQATYRMQATLRSCAEEDEAAIKVQCAFRVARARSLYFVTVEETMRKSTKHSAATDIQSCFRRWQSILLANKLRQGRVRINMAAIRIQNRYRTLDAQRRTEALKADSLMVQLAMKTAAAENAERKAAAARVIEQKMLAHLEQKQFQRLKRATSIIQICYRKHHTKMAMDAHTIVLITRLQTRYRGYRARKMLDQRKRFQVMSIVTIAISSCGHREANGRYETMGVADSAQYVMSTPNSDDSYILERSLGDGSIHVWILKLIKGSTGKTVVLYVNRIEGASLCPPRKSWQPVNGARPPPIIHWKTSSSYMNQLTMMNRTTIMVTDSGCSDVHGRYIQSGISDNVPQYVLRKTRTTVYMLLRTIYGDSKIWVLAGFLLLSSQGDSTNNVENADDSDKVKRVFYVNIDGGTSDTPPLHCWVAAQHGVDPVPLFVKQNKLNQSKNSI